MHVKLPYLDCYNERLSAFRLSLYHKCSLKQYRMKRKELTRFQLVLFILLIKSYKFRRIVRTIAQQEVYSFTSFAVVGEIELLLSDFSLSLKQVAAQMHFPAQVAFTKFYKSYTGQTPMQFRNRLK